MTAGTSMFEETRAALANPQRWEEPAAPPPDFDVIVPPVGNVVVAGHECRVRRLKTLEVMALLRVVTAGIGDGIGSMDFSGDREAMGPQLVALLVMSIPAAPQEMVTFVRRVVEPAGDLTEAQRKTFDAELGNPELEVLMSIVGKIVEQEKDDMSELLGKVEGMAKHLSALYQTGKKGS